MHARPFLTPGRSPEPEPALRDAEPGKAVGKRTRSEALAPEDHGPDEASAAAVTARAVASAATALPYGDRIQRAFGRHDVSGVQAHVGSEASVAARALEVDAFATGDHVVFDGAPDLRTVAHEAAHVIQQRGGVQLFGGVGRVGDDHERHADEVAAAVVGGSSAEALLDRYAGGTRAAGSVVQHMKRRRAPSPEPEPEPDRVTLLVNATLPPRNRLVVQALVDLGLEDPAVIACYPTARQLHLDPRCGSAARAAALATHPKLAVGDAVALLGSVSIVSGAQLVLLLASAKLASGAQLRALIGDAKLASGLQLQQLFASAKLASGLELQQLFARAKLGTGAELLALLQSDKVDSAASLGALLDTPIAPVTATLVGFFADPHVPSLTEVRRAVARDAITDWTAYWGTRRNVTDTDAHDQGYDALTGGTLDALYRHGEAQVDWHRGLVGEDQRGPIRLMLELLRNTPGALAGCGAWNVGEFWTAVRDGAGFDDAARQQVVAYARGVEGRVTCPVPVKPTVTRGLTVGGDVLAIEAQLGRPLAHAIFTADAYQRLRDDDGVEAFLGYVRDVRPALSAREGKEVESYVELCETADPLTYRAALADWVVNLHRFQAAALDALVTAVGDRSGALPVTVLVHSPLDRDGAFHHDPNLTAVITRGGHRTMLIEGHGTLAGVAGRLEVVRTLYCGVGERIANVMIVGHGESRSVAIAGTTDAEGNEDEVALDIDEDDGTAFLRTLIDGMVDGGDSHLVFNACHTDSTELENTRDLSHHGDAERDAERLRAYLAAHPSLAAFARHYVHGRQQLTVHGANAATREGVAFLDGDDQLTLRDDRDREIAGTKLAYVEHGTDPKGVMRAVLEVWAQRGEGDLERLRAAMERRVVVASTVLNERIIQAVFRLVIDRYWERARDIVRMIDAVSCLKKLRYEEDCTVTKLDSAGLNDDELAAIDVAAAGSTEWGQHFLPIVFGQRAGRPAAVVTALGHLRHAVRELVKDDRVHVAAGFDFAGQLPTLAPATATRGQVLLAIIGFKQHRDEACRAFLDAYFLAVPTELPWAADFQVTRASLMRDLGPPVGPRPRNANVRTGGERNTARLEPCTRVGRVEVDTRSYAAPDVAAAHAALARDTEVRVLGRMPGWVAIEHGDTTGFVEATAVALL